MKKKATTLNTEALAADLQAAFAAVTRILSSCPASLLNRRVAAGSWTPAQVTRHIIRSSSGIPDTHTQAADRPVDALEEPLKGIFLNLGTKLQAPDFVKPEEKEYTAEELLNDLENNQATLVAITQSKDLSVVCMDFEFPTVGHLTRYEWLKFIVFHTQRHTVQLHHTIIALHEKN